MIAPLDRRSGPRLSRGITLLELVITLAIVGILVATAQFTWREHTLRVRRGDATRGLLTLAAAQEAFYLETGRYSANVTDPPPRGLGLRGTENGWYRLRVIAADTGGFTAVASPAPGSPQARDEDCQRFMLDHRGLRDAAPGGAQRCWR